MGQGERLPMVAHLESLFPGLQGAAYEVTSPSDDLYNCIAWAANDKRRWWWPEPRRYWPAGVLREESLAAFQETFASLGYTTCADKESELGFDKIALFADADGLPTHAARQLTNGRWASKLGELEDIEHELQDLEGVEYGAVVLIMKRPASPAEAERG